MNTILEGVRILDFGRYIAGPFCAALLADLGAEVIRVERPGGGDDRFLMPATASGEGAMFLQANRGKKSLTLDISAPEARPLMRELIASSDIVIANFSPGALRHFQLDYDTLKSIKPEIILTTVSAFDTKGEHAESVGFDGVGQAISGAIYLTGEPDRPYRSATSYVDYSTAISAAFGTLAALIKRMKTGKGSHVEATLAGTALTIMNPVLIEQEAGTNMREPIGNRSPIAGPSDMYRAHDGWFIMQVIGQGMFKRWTRMVGRPDLFTLPRFANDIERGRNGAELSLIMMDWVEGKSRQECLTEIAAHKIGASPVLTPSDVMGGAFGLAGSHMQKVPYPGTDGISLVRPPASISSGIALDMPAPPRLGEHTDEILSALGVGNIAQLRDAKLV
ncbi:CaiB/BaiF CoA-transferase family protein [Hyphomonas sp. ND6WE1B]|uniref:CaiB/BaiF CoA transferase family protein n=1 Tax=Hyphomonas sp. ND6WE1B TaxID=1848191 RepID=UPI000A425272|nr:CoA transferase [Hyphomonas sp. ND6WE1B]